MGAGSDTVPTAESHDGGFDPDEHRDLTVFVPADVLYYAITARDADDPRAAGDASVPRLEVHSV